MKIARILICAAAAFAVWGIVPASANNSPWQMAEVVPITGTVKMKVHKFSRKHALKRKAIRQRQEYLRAVKQTKSSPDRKIAILRNSATPNLCASDPLRITALTRVVSWPIDQLVKPFVRPFKMTEPMDPWEIALIDDREDAIQYLVRTASPGGTMTRQGVRLSFERLHPEFAIRLAKAIREARANGLPGAGVLSAYRPPAYGVGGFRDKFNSMHAYGLAVDMAGIGGPGSKDAFKWFRIAGRNKIINPYGPSDRAESNHYQLTRTMVVTHGMPLRDTITGAGPKILTRMWSVAENLIMQTAYLGPIPEGRRRYARRYHRIQYARHKRVHYAKA